MTLITSNIEYLVVDGSLLSAPSWHLTPHPVKRCTVWLKRGIMAQAQAEIGDISSNSQQPCTQKERQNSRTQTASGDHDGHPCQPRLMERWLVRRAPAALLMSCSILPAAGPLFPYLRRVRAADRATEFRQRCRRLGIEGVTLHSYRYAWAERALQCGYPERFAQQALGHNSKAVHHAYSKHAEVTVPSLDDWEKQWKKNPHGMKQPNKVVAVDFWSNLDAPPSAGRNGSAARRCRL